MITHINYMFKVELSVLTEQDNLKTQFQTFQKIWMNLGFQYKDFWKFW